MEKALYFEIECLCSLILLMVLFLGIERKTTDKSQQLFRLLGIMVVLVMFGDGCAVFFNMCDTPAARFITLVASFVSDSAGQIVTCMWVWYTMMWVTNPDEFSFKKNMYLMIPGALGILILCFNIPFHFIFFIDEKNVFHRGPLFFVLFTIPFFYAFLAFIFSLIMTLNKKEGKEKNLFITSMMILPIIGGIIQLKSFGLPLIWPGMTFSLLTLYVKLQSHKEEKERQALQKMKYDLMQKDVSIMLSQIQPHFLYNALTTIKGLVMINSDQTCDAIDDFAFFLRGNMDSLASPGLIPFEKELQHTRQYLNLEKMRFGSRLNIVYKIEITSFNLPALSLQPIVENAVRYGITKKNDGGTVTISSMQKNGDIILSVVDDGTGFDLEEKKRDGRTHIGIQNVRDRIRQQCHGDLVITSVVGKGTAAVIIIPVKSKS